MDYLTRKEIFELDKKIDSRIPTFTLLKRPKNLALFHVFLHFYLFIDKLGEETNLIKRRNVNRKVYNGLNFVVDWIHKFCSENIQSSDLRLDQNVIRETEILFDEAIEYCDLFSQMSLIFRSRNQCRITKPNIFEISSATFVDEDLEAARQLIGSATDPTNFEDTYEILPQTIKYVKNKLSVKLRKGSDLNYSVSQNVFSNLLIAIEQRSILKWTMNPEWDLGGYTFSQLKKFWFVLKGLCVVHNVALESVRNLKKQFNLATRIKDRADWLNEIAKNSNLDKNVVKLIIDDLTYNESLYELGKQKPHVMYQPFFCFGDGKLALNSRIVRIANIERNAWSLTSVLRPELHSNLRNLKESFWIQEFKTKVESLGLKGISDVKFRSGNIDLLIIDENLKFGLTCELKWLTKSDDVKGTEETDREINKGTGQALKSHEWVKLNTSVLSQKISIREKELKKFEFKPLVICKDDLPSGYLGKTRVPVINQQLFDWIMGEPHHQDLRSLWNVADSISYLPKIGIHYRNLSPTIEWGEMRFILRNVASQAIKPWNPKRDILFEKI